MHKSQPWASAPPKTLALAAAHRTEVDAMQGRFVGSIKSCWITEASEGRIYYFKDGNDDCTVPARDFKSYFEALIKNGCDRLPKKSVIL